MYVYRLASLPNLDLASIDYAVMRNRLMAVPLPKLVGYSHLMLDKDRDHFLALIKHLDWNGSVASTIRCFTGFSPHSFTVGFLLCNGTNSDVFVGSPQPLVHLNDEALDHTDSSEKARTIAGMTGQTWIGGGEPVAHGGWRRSGRGNIWTTIEGTNCVVLPGPAAGTFFGLLRGGGTNRATTREFTSAEEVMDYIERNYRSLIKPWMPDGNSDDGEYPFLTGFGD